MEPPEEEENLILLAVKQEDTVKETIFPQQPDPMQERWLGRRIHAEDVFMHRPDP